MVGVNSIPGWFEALLNEKFFEPCSLHSPTTIDSCPDNSKKIEKNLFCFDCCSSVCPKCVFRHPKHVLLQARRYVYNDVLRLSDAQKLVDCSGVQPYITNSAKVVFLRQRPITRCNKGAANPCYSCNRSLQQPFIFCCLSCKVEHIIATQGTLKINVTDHKLIGFSDMDEFQVVTPDSVLDSASSIPTSSGSISSTDHLRTALVSTATTEIVRKKRSNLYSSNRAGSKLPAQPVSDHNSLNRRKKGVPNRAPMC